MFFISVPPRFPLKDADSGLPPDYTSFQCNLGEAAAQCSLRRGYEKQARPLLNKCVRKLQALYQDAANRFPRVLSGWRPRSRRLWLALRRRSAAEAPSSAVTSFITASEPQGDV